MNNWSRGARVCKYLHTSVIGLYSTFCLLLFIGLSIVTPPPWYQAKTPAHRICETPSQNIADMYCTFGRIVSCDPVLSRSVAVLCSGPVAVSLSVRFYHALLMSSFYLTPTVQMSKSRSLNDIRFSPTLLSFSNSDFWPFLLSRCLWCIRSHVDANLHPKPSASEKMDKNSSLSYGNLPRSPGPEQIVSTTAQVASVIELRPLCTANSNATQNNSNDQPVGTSQSASLSIAPCLSSSSEWSPPTATTSDNQVLQSQSSQMLSFKPLHPMVLSKPVYTATSTPEIHGPVESIHGPIESVTCPTLSNPLLTPPIKIHIHRPPSNPHSSPLIESSSPSQSQPTTQGQMFVVSSVPTPSSLSKFNSGTVAAKLGRRRASSNTATSGPNTGPQSTLSTVQFTTSSRRKSWDQRVAGPIRRASQALINLASASGVLSDSASMGSVFGSGSGLYGECSRRDSRIRMPEIMLMYSSFQRLPMKDFGAEVRASMDVDQFLQQAVLLLDITETSLEGIVDRMLRKVSIISLLLGIFLHQLTIVVVRSLPPALQKPLNLCFIILTTSHSGYRWSGATEEFERSQNCAIHSRLWRM